MRLISKNRDLYSNILKKRRGVCALCTSLLLLLAGTAVAGPVASALWEKAGHYYSQKKYDSAIAVYTQLRQREEIDPATLYYNLGNAYYRKGSIPTAILYYHKTLALNPKDKEAADNLALAQTKIEHRLTPLQPIFFIRWWKGLVHLLPAAYWAGLTFLIFVALLAYLYYLRTNASRPPHSGRWLSLILIILLLSSVLLFATHRQATRTNLAVVMQENAPLFHEASSNGTSISVPAGTTVSIQELRLGYYHIQLPNGAEGWMPQNFLTKVSDKPVAP